jgi:hypothetical protein
MTAPSLRRAVLAGLTASLALPAAASAAPLTVFGVFDDAALPIKTIALGLIAASLAAAILCAMKLASGPRLSGGSAFLSGLRLGGPLAGLVGAALTGLIMSLNLANATQPIPASALAPGFAEAIMLILIGLLAGMVAVVAHWAVEARIDRAVLKA